MAKSGSGGKGSGGGGGKGSSGGGGKGGATERAEHDREPIWRWSRQYPSK